MALAQGEAPMGGDTYIYPERASGKKAAKEGL